jgi:molybdate transport system substrate-binding protein
MRRRPRPAALLLLAALLAAGCGTGSGEPGDGQPGQQGQAGRGGTLTVFAAASLTRAFQDAGTAFEQRNPAVQVTFNFAGSQALATQIQQGAPADVFASADQRNMDKVAELVDRPRVLARNVLQIVVAKGNPKGVRSLADLARQDLVVVLAGPEVPAGRYAREALGRQGVTVRPRSLEETVKGVVGKVALGSADAGIVYVTDVAAGGDKVEGVDIPAAANVVAAYPIATVRASRNQPAAAAWVDFATSSEGQAFLKDAGFLPPE